MSFNPNQFVCPIDAYNNNELNDTVVPNLLKNCQKETNFSTLASYDKTFDDTKAVYDRTFLYTMNLGFGIGIICFGIFHHF